jgi:hypothetical protein
MDSQYGCGVGEKIPVCRRSSRGIRPLRPDEVAYIARELGITPKELYQLALKGPEAADLLKKMLLALGVDPKTLAGRDPILMRDLQQICITCGHKKQCSHELAAGTAAKNYLAFCPNAYTLETFFSAP